MPGFSYNQAKLSLALIQWRIQKNWQLKGEVKKQTEVDVFLNFYAEPKKHSKEDQVKFKKSIKLLSVVLGKMALNILLKYIP